MYRIVGSANSVQLLTEPQCIKTGNAGRPYMSLVLLTVLLLKHTFIDTYI